MVTIYFDLDGTLIDPKVGITRSIQYALRKLDLTVPHEDDLTWCIGPPALDSFKKLLGEDNLAHKALLLYRQRFSETGMYENTVYDGIVETLAALIHHNRRLFVATSKLQRFKRLTPTSPSMWNTHPPTIAPDPMRSEPAVRTYDPPRHGSLTPSVTRLACPCVQLSDFLAVPTGQNKMQCFQWVPSRCGTYRRC